MIDASKGFVKDGAKNRLRRQDIHKIVDVFTNQIEIARYSRMVPLSEIEDPKNEFNLNIPRYIDSSEPEDIQDLHAHLHGGVPERDVDALSEYWAAFPKLRSRLFKPNRPGYLDLAIDVSDVQQAILDSPEFQKFADRARALTSEWFTAHRRSLAASTKDTKPNDLIAGMGDDLLERFKSTPLLDEYDVYEQLMTYWDSVMHDDVFLIMQEGWADAARPRLAIEDKDRKLSEDPDLVIGSGRKAAKYKMDLIPPALIVARYFADEKLEVDELHVRAEAAALAVEEYIEERSGEEGILADAMDNEKITKALAIARLHEVRREVEPDPDEIAALEHLAQLYAAETAAKKAAKEAQAALDHDTLTKYGDVTDADVQQLVLDDKWAAAICERIKSEVNALTLALVLRIQQLGERYAETVGALDAELDEIKAKLVGHLAELGVT